MYQAAVAIKCKNKMQGHISKSLVATLLAFEGLTNCLAAAFVTEEILFPVEGHLVRYHPMG